MQILFHQFKNFTPYHVSKKDTSERRVILDLSFPPGLAVNDFINNEEYFGKNIDLIYPRVDDLIQLIKAKRRGCLLYKTDLRNAFRQIKICPGDYYLVSFIWKKHIFYDSIIYGDQIFCILLSKSNKRHFIYYVSNWFLPP